MSSSSDLEELARNAIDSLAMRGQKLALVETCTGGFIAALLTSEPGASRVFDWSLVAYGHEGKHQLLPTNRQVFVDHGSVSQQAVSELAQAGREVSGVDICLAISGIAGPGGGTPDKPVGTCWLALALSDGVQTQMIEATGDRLAYRRAVAKAALSFLV